MEGDALFPLEQGFRLSSVRVETLAGFPALEGHFRTVYGGVAPTVLTSVVVGTRYLYYIEFFGVSQPKVQERLFERIARSFTAS
jgi:hypothetical protein